MQVAKLYKVVDIDDCKYIEDPLYNSDIEIFEADGIDYICEDEYNYWSELAPIAHVIADYAELRQEAIRQKLDLTGDHQKYTLESCDMQGLCEDMYDFASEGCMMENFRERFVERFEVDIWNVID